MNLMFMLQLKITLPGDESDVQRCFDTPDGYKVCNLVRRGRARRLTATKSGKWWKFPLRKKWRKRNEKQGASNTSSFEKPVTVTSD